MKFLLLLVTSACAVKLHGPSQYDPVWLASVELYNDPIKLNESRLTMPKFVLVESEFRLYTRRNLYNFDILVTNDSNSLWDSHFNIENKIKVLTHGWLNNGSSPMPMNIMKAYLNVSDINIIVMDWGLAADVNYIWASYNVAAVGQLLTQFLNFLLDEGISMDDVHLIGHSLGAHVVGIAGAFVQNATIDTITGLDPALPLFSLSNPDARLDRHDARHVEVIHTCGGYLGFASPIGHMDFYPNGGTSQPGCGTDYRGFCAHNRAHLFFAESIASEVPFTAVRCSGYDDIRYYGRCDNSSGVTLPMGGFQIHYGKEGIYYLETREDSPYALGDVWRIPRQ